MRYILGDPKIVCRTGNEQAEACLRTLDDWGLRTSESSSWYINEVASDDIFNAHTLLLFEKKYGEILQGSSWRSHQREDYEEFLKLSLIFQGGTKGARVSFQAPGAFHHTRLMVKTIFSIKIFLFQQLFSPTAKEKHSVKELALFVSLVNFRFWHEAPLPIRTTIYCYWRSSVNI